MLPKSDFDKMISAAELITQVDFDRLKEILEWTVQAEELINKGIENHRATFAELIRLSNHMKSVQRDIKKSLRKVETYLGAVKLMKEVENESIIEEDKRCTNVNRKPESRTENQKISVESGLGDKRNKRVA